MVVLLVSDKISQPGHYWSPAGRLAGRPKFWIFFQFFFGPQNVLKLFPRALGGPGAHFPPIFRPFSRHFQAILGPWGAPGGIFFFGPFPLFFLSYELSLLGVHPAHFLSSCEILSETRRPKGIQEA